MDTRSPLGDRRRRENRDAKLMFREELLADRNRSLKRVCPCNICMGENRSLCFRAVVRQHLSAYGRHPYYRGSSEGFDKDDSDNEWDQDIAEEFGVRGGGNRREGDRPLDVGMNLGSLVQHVFQIYDGLGARIGNVQENLQDDPTMEEDISRPADRPREQDAEGTHTERVDGHVPFEEEILDDDLTAMEHQPPTIDEILEEAARTPLFAGSGLTQLGGTLLLLNCLRTHGASNILINEIFEILSKSMLPSVNSLPRNEYHASKVLKRLGLAYETIHCCPGPRTCVLFRGPEFQDMLQCPYCGAERYRQVGKSKVPAKVLRHFPLIPRLQRMFSTPLQASYMTWHASHGSKDGTMRGACDSYQWKFVNWRWNAEFAFEHRNLRLGLATDGVNPFSVKRSTWSTWPVLIMNYNLPPWMTTKKHFIMLSLIIPGKKSVTGDNFDTYLQPLLDELKVLWRTGVPTNDAAMYQGSMRFNMKAILLWTIHDFPAYGVVAGCVTKGYRGCPVCGPNTISWRSLALHKNVYDDSYRRFLPCGHPWRLARAEFNGLAENRQPVPRVTGDEVLRWGQLRENWLALGGNPANTDPARVYGIKRVSALFELDYWKELPIRNTLDIMHIERNVSDNIIKHLFGDKDTTATRRDMAQAGKMPELHMRLGSSGNYVKPRAPYVFTDHEKSSFLSLITATKVPTGYSSTLIKHVGEKRLNGLKSHDHHVLLQQVLPAAVRNYLSRGVRETIVRLGNLFQRICGKVIRNSEIEALRTCAAEVLCLLQLHFPPGCFDIMIHLIVHLVDELEICGPVHAQWCYSVERYLGVLTQYIRDKSKPEAGMASGYMIDESLGFCTEYFQLYEHTNSRVWDAEEELKDSGECLLGKPKPKRLSVSELELIHDYIIKHLVHTEELLGEWTEQRRMFKQARLDFSRSNPRRPGSQIQYPELLATPFPSFANWLNEHVRALKDEDFPVSAELDSLHCPPSEFAMSFNAMWAYGCHYVCSSELGPTSVAFDCEIAAIPPSPTSTEIDVGILKNIVMVTYLGLNCVLMEASWIKSIDQGRRVVKRDPLGFWIVQYSSRETRAKDNPYVYPASVSQVFFVNDSNDPAWKVVLRHDPRSKRIEGDRDIQIFGAQGSARPNLSTRSGAFPQSNRTEAHGEDTPEEVPADQFNVMAHDDEHPEDISHLEDTQYEDDIEFLPGP